MFLACPFFADLGRANLEKKGKFMRPVKKVLAVLGSIFFVLGMIGMCGHELLTMYIATKLWGILGLLGAFFIGISNIIIFFYLWFTTGNIVNLYSFSFLWVLVSTGIAILFMFIGSTEES